jgi:hypothetical protein
MNSFPPMIAMSLFDGQVLGPIILGLGFLTIPIVSMLTRHQRKMAEIIHGNQRSDVILGELEQLKSEVSELRSQLRGLGPPSPAKVADEELARRLG